LAVAYFTTCVFWIWKCIENKELAEASFGITIGTILGLVALGFIVGIFAVIWEKITGKKLGPSE